MPRKYSRSSKSLRSRRSRRIRRQRGGGNFDYEYIVTYNGTASAGAAKLDAAKAVLAGSPFNIKNLVETPVPSGTPAAPSGKVRFKWTVTRDVPTQTITTPANQLTEKVNSVTGSNKIDGFLAEGTGNTLGPTPAAAPAAAPATDPNVAEIYLFVEPASTNPVKPPFITKGSPTPFTTKTALTNVSYIDGGNTIPVQGISIGHPKEKKISRVEFSPILVSSGTTAPQKFSVESSATLTGSSLEKLYTSPTANYTGVLILPKLTDPTMYGSGTTKNWGTSATQETQNLLPAPVPGYQGPPPNLKITITFVNV